MVYKAFIPAVDKKIHFKPVIEWFEKQDVERGLISQTSMYRVHEYNFNNGPLIQIVGSIDRDWSNMERSYLSDFRALGSIEEISEWVNQYNYLPRELGAPLREVKVLLPTDIGRKTSKELEKLSKEEFVIKGEFRSHILDATILL